jgi:hypothetical protein
MSKVYVVSVKWQDENDYLTDYVPKAFTTREKAEKVVEECIKEELETAEEGYYKLGNDIIRREDELIVSSYRVLSFDIEE